MARTVREPGAEWFIIVRFGYNTVTFSRHGEGQEKWVLPGEPFRTSNGPKSTISPATSEWHPNPQRWFIHPSGTGTGKCADPRRVRTFPAHWRARRGRRYRDDDRLPFLSVLGSQMHEDRQSVHQYSVPRQSSHNLASHFSCRRPYRSSRHGFVRVSAGGAMVILQ